MGAKSGAETGGRPQPRFSLRGSNHRDHKVGDSEISRKEERKGRKRSFTTKITKDTKVSKDYFPNFVLFVSFVVKKAFAKLSNCFCFTLLDTRFEARIETQGVVPENFTLQFVADIFAVNQIRNVLAEVALIPFVRVV